MFSKSRYTAMVALGSCAFMIFLIQAGYRFSQRAGRSERKTKSYSSKPSSGRRLNPEGIASLSPALDRLGEQRGGGPMLGKRR